MAVDVDRAPQPPVLGHGDDHAASRDHGTKQLARHAPIVIEVFEHVAAGDDVELAIERQPPGVHLVEVDAGKPAPGDPERNVEQLAARQRSLGKPPAHRGEHGAAAAAHVEQRAHRREVPLERPDEQLGAGAKPEVRILGRHQFLVAVGRVAAVTVAEGRCEVDDILAPLRLMPASRARPVVRARTRAAGGTDSHTRATAGRAAWTARPQPLFP